MQLDHSRYDNESLVNTRAVSIGTIHAVLTLAEYMYVIQCTLKMDVKPTHMSNQKYGHGHSCFELNVVNVTLACSIRISLPIK